MIVAETGDDYRFVTQPDHASLAGQFAECWGNDAFDRPEPVHSVVLAAYDHDDGWLDYDRRPHLAEDGTPIDFREMPAGPWVDLYDEGIEAVADVDPYAGLLVSMHGAGLRNRRYGLSPSWPPTGPGFEAFVDRQQAFQRRLASDLRAAGRLSAADESLLAALHESGSPPGERAAADSRLWRNYALLQAWDTLSLAFCTTVSPPGYPTIDSVPAGADSSTATLAVEPLGECEFRVVPYPFEAEPLVASVPSRTVRTDAFDDEAGLLRAYYGSEREVEAYTLRGGEP